MDATPLSWFSCPTRIHLGEGAHVRIAEELERFGVKRLFFALDPALTGGPLHTRIQALLDSAGAQCATFTAIEPDPSVHAVEKALELAQQVRAQAVLAVGGGSTIDIAKAVALLATNGGRIHDYEGIDRFSQRPLPRIALPTTAGTGSEVSGSCVITDTAQSRKMSIRHAVLNPADVAILDPLALATLPAHVAVHAGLDAFTHAFESFISRQANPLTDALNLQAIELLCANLPTFAAQRSHAEAGLAMLCGSTLAGMTFGITGLGNVHCMARFLGARLHLSHGLSNALCLPTVARFNLQAAVPRYARVARAMGCAVEGLAEREAAQAALEAIAAMCAALGVPRRLREVGAEPAMLPEFARRCAEAGYNRWNPRHTTEADFLALFEQAW